MDEPEAGRLTATTGGTAGSTGMTTRGVMMAIAVAWTFAWMPGPAPAATVGTRYDDGGSCDICSITGVLAIAAPKPETNEIEISQIGQTTTDESDLTTLRVTDQRAALTPGRDCVLNDPHTATCRVERFGLIDVSLGTRDDALSALLAVPIVVHAGAGNDVVTTGSDNDTIDLGPDDDRAHAGGGDDSIVDSGGRHQVLDGGAGTDELDFHRRTAAMRIDLAHHLLSSRTERSRIDEIENVIPGRGNDDVRGDARRNIFEEVPGACASEELAERQRDNGDDRYDGGGGNDGIVSLGGDDRLRGSDGRDWLRCQPLLLQRCWIVGGSGGDRLDGSRGADRLSGGSGRDSLNGEGGRDLLRSLDGERDRVVGGRGRDEALFNRGLDRVTGVEVRLAHSRHRP